MTTAMPDDDEDLGSPMGDFSTASVLVPAAVIVIAAFAFAVLMVWL